MVEVTQTVVPMLSDSPSPALTTQGVRCDIEADWLLMSTCNYRCVYCFWDAASLGRKISPPGPVEDLAAFFDKSGLTWLLHLTGGEPFHYPRFVDLCRLLTDRHHISINTNADSPRVASFVDLIDPARVSFINCGVHLEQRQQRGRTEPFIKNVHLLRGAGFDTFVSCVMYPPTFPLFVKAWERFAAEGVFLIPKALQGRHLGRSFPQDYTESERALFLTFAARAREAHADQVDRRVHAPTVDPFLDEKRFLYGLPDNRGRLCHAGRHFVRIRENGDIHRCGPGVAIGNIAQGWFGRRPGPTRCAELECPYFCEKYRVEDRTERPQSVTIIESPVLTGGRF